MQKKKRKTLGIEMYGGVAEKKCMIKIKLSLNFAIISTMSDILF